MKKITDQNRLSLVNPKLAKEWNYQKNGNLTPDEISCGSERKVWWKCSSCGFEWESVVYSRNKGHGCPICGKNKQLETSHRNRIVNNGSLAVNRPDIAEEWHSEKNSNLTPEQVTTGYNKSVWWKCKKCGYEFKTSPNNRVNKNSKCPKCTFRYHTSLAEQTLFYYIKKVYDDTVNSYKNSELGRFEIDIYIPSIRIGIEYDGENWHKDKKKDLRKYNICKKNNITLIRIIEIGKKVSAKEISCDSSDYVVLHNSKDKNGYNHVISELNNIFPLNIKANIESDQNDILSLFYGKLETNSLSSCFPQIIEEWNYKKNIGISPDMFTYGSKAVVWWKCSLCGYEWQESINSRMQHSNLIGCSLCNKKKGAQRRINNIINENGSLADEFPELVAEWLFENNEPITPNDVTSHSHKEYWWHCRVCGYKWKSSIANRTKGQGCPKCARIKTEMASKKCVLNVETGEIFDSLKSAGNSVNLTYSSISSCCRGKSKTAGGYHWKFVEKE